MKKNLDNLFCDAVDVKPLNYDFGKGYAEEWDTVYPDVDDWTIKQCREWLDEQGRDETSFGMESDSEDEQEWQSTVRDCMLESENYAPMMNCIYPLPDLRHSEQEAQALIEDTNCVIVLIRKDERYPDTPYMALSGGGMDLSWDICRAYMLLGYLPPVHFCRLPAFAGKKLNGEAEWVVNGCVKSCEIAKNQAEYKITDLQHLREILAKN